MPIIQSVERALRILDLFDEYDKELKITEISSRMELHKSTVHSLLKTLQEHRYIEQNEESGKYRLGMKLLERSSQLIHGLDVRQAAKSPLTELSKETGLTVHLVVLDGQEGVYIDKVEGAKATIRYSRVGRRIPVHCSAVGKALIACLPEEKLAELLQGYAYKPHTERTIRSEAELRRELEKVREAGYAVDDQENEPGVCCLAVPIRDHSRQVVAAASISMLAARVTEPEKRRYAGLLGKMGEAVSAKMGYGLL